jgi:hypothetical protein
MLKDYMQQKNDTHKTNCNNNNKNNVCQIFPNYSKPSEEKLEELAAALDMDQLEESMELNKRRQRREREGERERERERERECVRECLWVQTRWKNGFGGMESLLQNST